MNQKSKQAWKHSINFDKLSLSNPHTAQELVNVSSRITQTVIQVDDNKVVFDACCNNFDVNLQQAKKYSCLKAVLLLNNRVDVIVESGRLLVAAGHHYNKKWRFDIADLNQGLGQNAVLDRGFQKNA